MSAEDVVRLWKDPDRTSPGHPAGQIMLDRSGDHPTTGSDVVLCTSFESEEDDLW
ncbi:hypothetical protein [Longispora albida]|uniref:hypothetical protein n=1 Tax=Longispora albida TaxID=203523 RepID=UPI00036F6934|nr:hypothetical protein [Longispora albida]